MTVELAARGAPRTRGRRGPLSRMSSSGSLLLMVAPALVALALFQYYPIVVACLQSFQSFNPFTHTANGSAGFANYSAIFHDPAFLAALRNTGFYIALTIGIELPLGLFLASVINAHLPTSRVLASSVIAAMAASEAVAVVVWGQIVDPSQGLLNAFFHALGLPKQLFLTSSHQALVTVVIMWVWRDLGMPTLIYLAGLQGISPELYEAADLDGASRWRKFRHITLPMLKRSTMVAAFMGLISGARIFTPLVLLTQGGPANSTVSTLYYSYQQGFQFSNTGAAEAAAVCMLLLLGVLVLLLFAVLRDRD